MQYLAKVANWLFNRGLQSRGNSVDPSVLPGLSPFVLNLILTAETTPWSACDPFITKCPLCVNSNCRAAFFPPCEWPLSMPSARSSASLCLVRVKELDDVAVEPVLAQCLLVQMLCSLDFAEAAIFAVIGLAVALEGLVHVPF